MNRTRQIHDFAIKWMNKFSNQDIDYLKLSDHYMADDCAALGFKMDRSKSFEQLYGSAAYDSDELTKVINDVTDINLLGSAIFSMWRWAYYSKVILKPKNRKWFILALSKLELLSQNSLLTFQGTLKKMRIVSNDSSYWVIPTAEDEIEQQLTINDKGSVSLSGYYFGDKDNQKVRRQRLTIDKSAVDKLFSAISMYFSDEYDEIFATDIGGWTLELTNTDGKKYKYKGSLCAKFIYQGTDLSDLIRDTLDMDDLFVFDGKYKLDVITKITLDYHRVPKTNQIFIPGIAKWKYEDQNYTEQLIIDRKTETLKHTQNTSDDCNISHEYKVKGAIKDLLDNFSVDDLFSFEIRRDDEIKTLGETNGYQITIDFKKKPQRVIRGPFDSEGLPDGFDKFAEEVSDFLSLYGSGEILAPSIYGKSKRHKNDYIFCSVAFDEGQKSYYYLTDDDSIEIGDFVVVPAGRDNHEAVVEVVNIEYFNEANAPLPIEKTKRIIKKSTYDDF